MEAEQTAVSHFPSTGVSAFLLDKFNRFGELPANFHPPTCPNKRGRNNVLFPTYQPSCSWTSRAAFPGEGAGGVMRQIGLKGLTPWTLSESYLALRASSKRTHFPGIGSLVDSFCCFFRKLPAVNGFWQSASYLGY